MAKREDLQALLEEMLGSRNVYYQPPESIKMEYPAIKYNLEGYDIKRADNMNYTSRKRYTLIVIDKRPDNPVIEELMTIPYCSYDRQYKSENLNHDVLTLYF